MKKQVSNRTETSGVQCELTETALQGNETGWHKVQILCVPTQLQTYMEINDSTHQG